VGYCKNCGAEIEWLRLTDGRNIPVDPEPELVKVGEGTEYFYDEEMGELWGRVARPEETQTVEQRIGVLAAYVPHWRTCRARWNLRKRQGSEGSLWRKCLLP
jgi:hypothetical protein